MARNPERRADLTDAGLRLLARMGARGLTHRAVDAEAKMPAGTSSNYFRTRGALLAALGERIFERLAAPPAVLANPRARPPTMSSLTHYVRDIVRRTTEAPGVTLALIELRLEATRNEELADSLGATMRRRYAIDCAFHAAANLPGGPLEIALLHYAIDGLLLDRLAPSIGSRETTDEAVSLLVTRLVGAGPRRGRRKAPKRSAGR